MTDSVGRLLALAEQEEGRDYWREMWWSETEKSIWLQDMLEFEQDPSALPPEKLDEMGSSLGRWLGGMLLAGRSNELRGPELAAASARQILLVETAAAVARLLELELARATASRAA